ncbi:LD-carboxypeptidase, partial [Arthrospira platensis SPKY1]|nr:LD-carboxypeptidase [Arthrospira platensis SPKY1]
MISPPNLQKGELVAFAAPARSISNQELQAAINSLLQQGFRYRLDDEVLAVHNQFAGNAKHRTDHFQRLLDDPDVKVILCARGGYGSLQIIDQLNFNQFRKYPKWIVGYSDITVLHARLQSEGFQSLHATMPV